MGGVDRKIGDSSLVHDTFERPGTAIGPGKGTLTQQLTPELQTGSAVSLVQRKATAATGDPSHADPGAAVHAAAEHGIAGESAETLLDQMQGSGGASTAIQRAPANHPPATDKYEQGPHIAAATPGIDKPGFIDNGSGAPLYNRPPEAGGQLVREAPLPPTTRVFVSGTYPKLSGWWYVTAFLDQTMVRGYVEWPHVATDLPEPLAELRQLKGGETAEKLAVEKYHQAIRNGHDLRYYENVLLYVNQQHKRKGVVGKYQVPGILGNGSNNVQLVAPHRIWLVSPQYAEALENVVPSGSLTGGAVAKVKGFMGHLEDILKSVTESSHHLDEVAGEYAQAIRDHMAPIIGITAAFIGAEAISMFAAASPTGVGQAVAVVIQLALSAFGAAGMVQGGVEALKHGNQWLTTAWTAKGDKKKIVEASKEFLRMLVAIAIAAFARMGVKGNYRNALKIANSMPTGGLPALATANGAGGGTGTGAGVKIGPGVGGIGAAGAQATKHHDSGGGSETPETTKEPKETGKPPETTKHIQEPHSQAKGEDAAATAELEVATSPKVTEPPPRTTPPPKATTEPPAKTKTHSEHARARAAQGRRMGPAFNDAQSARQADVYVQPDGRYVVRGPRGREHIFEADGTHVTSIDRSARAHQGKVEAGERVPITTEGYDRFKEILR